MRMIPKAYETDMAGTTPGSLVGYLLVRCQWFIPQFISMEK